MSTLLFCSEVAHARRMNMKQIELKRNRKAQEQREYLFAKEMARIHVSNCLNFVF